MKTIVKKLGSKSINIYFLSDVHYGTLACDTELLKQEVGYIAKDKDAVVIGLGDYAEFIPHTDLRYAPKVIPPELINAASESRTTLIKKQEERVIELLFPIKDKIICIQPGNHEDRLERTYHYPVTDNIAKGLQTELGDWLMYYRFIFGSKTKHDTLTILATHGSISASTFGAALNAMDKYRLDYEADIYVLAHCHFKGVVEVGRYYLAPVSNKTVHITQLKILSGGYTQPVTDCTVYTESTKIGCGSRIPGCASITYKPFSRHPFQSTAVLEPTFQISCVKLDS